ncbi:TPA: GIY-YIG nuclease family protein [Streptococcus pneumoniae]|uniref:GIY-YIG nuclease family protein n=1 Tax=Streptococcus pneumoniae TaxID=1313 RepID=UPI000B594C7D|nr:GIY-YIG nuclease family protein [Streptococcus pneumoniae]MDV8381493.1 GIY-YIG nuclease family protein [Streptococcus pneumoniae]SNQ05498.1 GIY-YIG domain-containing protein [Streptococcus pneumoniae]VQA45781.1 GIY-YIG domain-containing protein [Streptococcus pneumoniae]VSR08943.1 GIY-YIG domain-containing protein [Streptococcus pneumoniae]HEU7738927.1 GIY-YIG nuclease family protein [Streptococcus pneumoniae]
MDHKAYMYVLECRDGSYYIGYTTDVRRRLAIHNSGRGAKYKGFASKEEAMSAEALLKRKKRPQKEEFLSENQDRNLLSYFEESWGVL